MPKLQDDLKRAIQENQSDLTVLHLSNMGLTDEDIDELVTLLAQNTSVQSINLYRNNLTAHSAKQLAKLTTIKSIDMGGNDIGDDGVKALASNDHIKSLALNQVAMTNDGARFLATSAKQTYINIEDNRQVTSEVAMRVKQRVLQNVGSAKLSISTAAERKAKDSEIIKNLSKSITQALGAHVPTKEKFPSSRASVGTEVTATIFDSAKQLTS